MKKTVNTTNSPAIHHHTPTSKPNKLSRFLKALRKVSNNIYIRFVDLFCGCFSKPKPKTENTKSKTTQGDSQANCLSTAAKSTEEIMELVENHTYKHPADLQKYHGATIEYRHVFSQLREKEKTVLTALRLPEKANLTNANLDGFKLIWLNAQGADFRGSTLKNTDIGCAGMFQAKLDDIDLRTTNLLSTNFREASLQNVNFSGNKWLDNVNFSEANLQKANFNETKWVLVNFTQANLEGATFNNAIFGSGTQLSLAILDQAELQNATCMGTSFYYASLRGANLEGANCNSANFKRVKLTGAILTNANFTGADLTNAKLKGANLKGTDFTNADLRNVDMTEDELLASGAILNGAKVGNDSTWKKL
ncbi:pentapeptide repeat-containing protein [Candidatus Williamhamiltonella defendens]|uniref:pentapeptide repeat-containing protein n=1 Tax=Candidatus Williamhamiltonella defendens TaxID=138072 RepID=UPI001582BC22|nr:pentapeptide repeat-containing protein [Candidatus Hamiltonella defensa]